MTYNPEYEKEYRKKYRLTPRGRAISMWKAIKHRCGNIKFPTYVNVEVRCSREEFLSFAISALEVWSVTNNIASASIDRINGSGHYEIENLQILDRWENSKKKEYNHNLNAPADMAWCSKCKDYLPREEFTKNASNLNGLSNMCKPHRRESGRRWDKKQKIYFNLKTVP